MMRLPARLIAKLMRARIAQALQASSARSFIQHIDAAEILHPGTAAPVSHEKMQSILQSALPMVWIGGSEPLIHPGIGHFVRAIARSGHCIFLETNGTLLRRRIHEFQPLPQVFLVVRLSGERASEFDLAVEGLRAARLSGFFTVVHSLVGRTSKLPELARTREFLAELRIDGWLITAESADPGTIRNAAEARSHLLTKPWRWFSRRIERELLAHPSRTDAWSVSSAQEPDASREETCEESVKAL